MTESLAHGYSSESAQGQELSNGYPHDRAKMIFITFCVLKCLGENNNGRVESSSRYCHLDL